MLILWVNFTFVRQVNIAALAGVSSKLFTLQSKTRIIPPTSYYKLWLKI